EYACEDKQITFSSNIGQHSDIKTEFFSCSNAINSVFPMAAMTASPPNVCGAPCKTNCFNPAGGGPDPNDCQVIADALLYESQNSGEWLCSVRKTAGVSMTYKSCKTFILDQAGYDLTYCKDDWAAVIKYVAFNCQAQQNAHGGNCVANDQRWFIQCVRLLSIRIMMLTREIKSAVRRIQNSAA
ncbi:hypothetical protein BV22DRAFT_1171558, partial [Leucogyrophana mollusca]